MCVCVVSVCVCVCVCVYQISKLKNNEAHKQEQGEVVGSSRAKGEAVKKEVPVPAHWG